MIEPIKTTVSIEKTLSDQVASLQVADKLRADIRPEKGKKTARTSPMRPDFGSPGFFFIWRRGSLARL
jgi:hypothetical protein